METLVYVLLKRVTDLEVDSISYIPITPVSHIKTLIYNKNTEVCDLLSQRDVYINSNTRIPSDLEENIETNKLLISSYSDLLETNRISLQKNENTLQNLRTIRKLYRSISSVLDNTSPCIFYTLYILGHFNTIVHSTRDDYETMINALYRIADTLYNFDGDTILSSYIPIITHIDTDPVIRAIFFAYNDSIRNTSTFSNNLELYRRCIISYGSFTQKELTNFVSHLVNNYIYTNHHYPPIIFNALHITLDELKLEIHSVPDLDWIYYEVCLLDKLLHKLQYMKSYHEKIKRVVTFEHECTLYNVSFLKSSRCPVELVCARIIQSYKYTSIRMNSLVPTLLDGKPRNDSADTTSKSQYDDHSIRVWICIFLVTFFSVLIMKVSFRKT